jgi:DNA mismatch repair protein MutS
LPRVENFYFLIEEKKDKLTFKYKIAKGTALKSYGVYAAQLAGLPKPVVHRAEELLQEYEKADGDSAKLNSDFSEIELKLSEIDTDNLSPVEALMKIYELKTLLIKGAQVYPELKKAFG